MKTVFLLLFCPCILAGQTIHFEDDEIVYKGKFDRPSRSTKATNVQEALMEAAGEELQVETVKNKFIAKGAMELQSPFRIIRTLHYSLYITEGGDGFGYRIDSVYVNDKRRGGRTELITAKDLLKGRDQTGPPAIANEKLLNEIDMRFQKILASLKKKLSR